MRIKVSNFITNASDVKTLGTRVKELCEISREMKFLIGFFYFSGLEHLYEGLEQNESIVLRILVGLEVDEVIMKFSGISKIKTDLLIEVEHGSDKSENELVDGFIDSLKKSLNQDEYDNKQSYEKLLFFLKMIEENRLIIRKTFEPNHAKLYIFSLKDARYAKSLFITGSSNLTRAGLENQKEFNVEIKDYGTDEAEAYFEKLWNSSVKLTEKQEVKKRIIDTIKKETLVREITPYEAYCLVLKSYVESFEQKSQEEQIKAILKEAKYREYKYQIDAISQALAIIEKHNGVLIADVVGLGKTIIACVVAKLLGLRGAVICPPSLMGDLVTADSGWKKYIEEFKLYDWNVFSSGDLENVSKRINSDKSIEVIIVDEAHRFRNEDTRSYELLHTICRNKKVILLTATPFNNKPYDVLALIKLFVVPNMSNITIGEDLSYKFKLFSKTFDDLNFIAKNYKSTDPEKGKKVKTLYFNYFNDADLDIDLEKVKNRAHNISKNIRDVIEPITIRRNRLDLTKNPKYKDEINNLSRLADPQEWFYELNCDQNKFYDDIISRFFVDVKEGGLFKCAIYRPFYYEDEKAREMFGNIDDSITDTKIQSDDIDKRGVQREFISQKNLSDIIKRLLIKRFESSFGAFADSIGRFIRIHNIVLDFITKSGKYMLDRDEIEKIYQLDEDSIEDELQKYFESNTQEERLKGKKKIYVIKNFKYREEFLKDIKSDLELLMNIQNEIEKLELEKADPKADCIIKKIKEIREKEPDRKIVIFSEYADTVRHLSSYFEKKAPALLDRTLVIKGSITKTDMQEILQNFDASFVEDQQQDIYDILISTDKLSEGFNLNRAGMVINYDIPWNPVRVIQRVGRINRISKKVFDELYIVNFFPTEKGATYVKSKEIAQNKMFMIHNTLGEDAKIFDIYEQPTAAKLYSKINQNPDKIEDVSLYTIILSTYESIKAKNPEIIERLSRMPNRVKVIKKGKEDELLVFIKKGKLFVERVVRENGSIKATECTFEDIKEKIEVSPEEKGYPIDEQFWQYYTSLDPGEKKRKLDKSEQSPERKALNLIGSILSGSVKFDERFSENINELKPFLNTLREDIIDFGSLPDYTLRKIGSLQNGKVSDKVSIDDQKDYIDKIFELKQSLGEDYLENIKKRNLKFSKKIIVAINNRK